LRVYVENSNKSMGQLLELIIGYNEFTMYNINTKTSYARNKPLANTFSFLISRSAGADIQSYLKRGQVLFHLHVCNQLIKTNYRKDCSFEIALSIPIYLPICFVPSVPPHSSLSSFSALLVLLSHC